MLAVCMRVPNELAVSVLRGPVRNRNRHSSTGNRAYRKRVRVLETCRRSNSKDRSRWCVAVGSGHSFRLLLLSEAAGSSFSFLSLPSPPLFPTRRKRTFFPCHAFTHARHLCTQHAPLSYAVCICTRLFRRYEFKCDQRGGGSSFRHFSRRASNLPFLVEMDLLPREEILLLLETILFLGNFIILV